MPLNLETKRIFSQITDRVKGVDLHPKEPWLLACLYNGDVKIWNYNDGSVVASFQATELPVRTAKFAARKQWVITGSDDMMIRVFSYNTRDKIKTFEAHTDYIRQVIHPTLSYLLTSSDDMLIKLWDWDNNWKCSQVFEGHAHYVVFNPKDTNTFASASLDRTVKVWSLGSPVPNFTLEGHEKGVNAVDYYSGGDRPYLVSAADDKTVRVWDYQTKVCVQVLQGHTHNVSAVVSHPEKPVIVSGSEDGTFRLFHSTTFRLEDTINDGKDRVWTLACRKGLNLLAVGFDAGPLVIKLGKEEPLASMDASGKIIWAKNNEIQTTNLKSLPSDHVFTDGERLPLSTKELGTTDNYPQSLQHNRNGRFVAVCGDGEYIIYTALAWRNKSFGSADQFVWGSEASEYAIKAGWGKIQIYKNFQEKQLIKLGFSADKIYGGTLIGATGTDYIIFYDWTEGRVVRRIDVKVKNVYWSDSGDWVAIATADSFYILEFKQDVVDGVFNSGQEIEEDGIEEAFEVVQDVSEQVVSAIWVGDCFVYNNSAWRLNYCVGGEVSTLCHLDRPMYLLGYMTSQSRVYLIDKDFSIASYTLLLSVIEYKTLMIRGDMEAAAEVLKTIPEEKMNEIAKFLESRNMPSEALEIATDPDYRFDLAVQLGRLEMALKIAEEVDSEIKWKQLGELAMSKGKLKLCETCLLRGKDLSGLLLLYTSKSSRKGVSQLLPLAKQSGDMNIAFMCHFLLADVDGCIDLLIETERLPEAAFFARTYAPSRISEIVTLWKDDVRKINPKAAEALADPQEFPNLFPNLELALKAETIMRQKAQHPLPASHFPQVEGSNTMDLLQTMESTNVVEENGDVSHPPEEETETFVDAVELEGAPVEAEKVEEVEEVEEADLDDWGLDDE